MLFERQDSVSRATRAKRRQMYLEDGFSRKACREKNLYAYEQRVVFVQVQKMKQRSLPVVVFVLTNL